MRDSKTSHWLERPFLKVSREMESLLKGDPTPFAWASLGISVTYLVTRVGSHSTFFTSQCSLRRLLCQKETTSVATLGERLGEFYALPVSVMKGLWSHSGGLKVQTQTHVVTAFHFILTDISVGQARFNV